MEQKRSRITVYSVQLVKERNILLDTPYFQQNIGRQRFKIIQYWIENMGEKE